MRWGTKRSRHCAKTGYGPYHPEMDDWGFGAVWNSRFEAADWQLFAMQKDTASVHDRSGRKHPRRQVNLVGTRFVPRWSDELSTPLEAMGQVGRNGDGDTLWGYLAYAGIDWKKKTESTFKPFVSSGLMVMSGDKNAKDEDGGHGAWDPMWYRAIDAGEKPALPGRLHGAVRRIEHGGMTQNHQNGGEYLRDIVAARSPRIQIRHLLIPPAS